MYVLMFYYIDRDGNPATHRTTEADMQAAYTIARRWCRKRFWHDDYYVAPAVIRGCQFERDY